MRDDKQAVRELVWSRMQAAGVARFPGARGRIPNFVGAEAAARTLAATEEWRRADTVKSNPDAPQLPVRTAVLADGKLLFMAVPRLRTAAPFLALDPATLEVPVRAAASISGSSEHGVPTAIADLPHIDLIVCGSVAVDARGTRIGKGGGYSDLEFALLQEAKLIDRSTVVATTVHPLQVLDGGLPETEHDFRVELIATPDGVIRPPRAAAVRHRPRGILWDHIERERVDAIPALRGIAPEGPPATGGRSDRSGSA